MHIISGIYRNRKLETPKGSQTRPSSGMLRQAVFNICQTSIEGCRFLDLFAGSGAMGLEALSRGASFSTFVEQHKEAFRCITSNITALGVKAQTEAYCSDVFLSLEKLVRNGKEFDIIYVDPPYNTLTHYHGKSMTYSCRVLLYLDAHNLLAKDGVLFIEESAGVLDQLPPLKTLHLEDQRQYGKTSLNRFVQIT